MNRPEREGFITVDETEGPEIEQPRKRPTAAIQVEEEKPAAEAQPPEALEDLPEWPMTIKLQRKAIEVGPGKPPVDELTFREPTAGDLIRAGGNPCRIEIVEMGGGTVTWQPVIDDIKMLRLMASLAGVHEPYLQRMDPRDYASCAHRLRRFFLPEQGIW